MGASEVQFLIEDAVRTSARPIVQESTLLKGMRQEVGKAKTARDTTLTVWERHADSAMTLAKVARLPVPQQVTLMGLVDRVARVTVYELMRYELRPYIGQMTAPDLLLAEIACWWCGEMRQVGNPDRAMKGIELAREFGMSQPSVCLLKKRVWAQMDHWLDLALERMGWALEGEE